MRTGNLAATAALACTILLTGCSQLKALDKGHRIESVEQVSRVDEHSSYPSVRRLEFEQLNLIELIDPYGVAATKYASHWEATKGYTDERRWGVKYDLVLAHFRESAEDPDSKRVHRNSVQDRILAVATSRCNVFKTYLRRQQTEVNFLLGSAVTMAGVLGAILPGVNASRNLAGTAGILSGVQSEYNQQFFSSLAAHVIVQGIELRQNRFLAALVRDRQNLLVTDYSMEAAIKDAILFDGSCSTLTGLSEASESIKEVTSPGLPRAAEILAGVRALHEVAQAENFSEMAESGKLQKLLKHATPLTSPLIVSMAKPTQPGVPDKIVAASQVGARIKTAISTRAAKVGKAYAEAQAKLAEDKRNKALDGAAVTRQFGAAVETPVTSPLPLAACVTALTTPAEELGKANALVAITKEGSPERLKAVAALDKARADATLAVNRVELLVDAANAALDATVDKWVPEVTKADFDDAKLKALPVVAPGSGLKDLCK